MKNLSYVILTALILMGSSCKKDELENPVRKVTLLKSVEIEGVRTFTFEYDNSERVTKINQTTYGNDNWFENIVKYREDGKVDSVISVYHSQDTSQISWFAFSYSDHGRHISVLKQYNYFNLTNVYSLSLDLNVDNMVTHFETLNNNESTENFYSNNNRDRYISNLSNLSTSFFIHFNTSENPLYFNPDLHGVLHCLGMIGLDQLLYSKNLPTDYTVLHYEGTFTYDFNANNLPIKAIHMGKDTTNSTFQTLQLNFRYY